MFNSYYEDGCYDDGLQKALDTLYMGCKKTAENSDDYELCEAAIALDLGFEKTVEYLYKVAEKLVAKGDYDEEGDVIYVDYEIGEITFGTVSIESKLCRAIEEEEQREFEWTEHFEAKRKGEL